MLHCSRGGPGSPASRACPAFVADAADFPAGLCRAVPYRVASGASGLSCPLLDRARGPHADIMPRDMPRASSRGGCALGPGGRFMIWSLVYSLPRVEELPVASSSFWFPSAGRSRLLRCQLSFLRGRGGAGGRAGRRGGRARRAGRFGCARCHSTDVEGVQGWVGCGALRVRP